MQDAQIFRVFGMRCDLDGMFQSGAAVVRTSFVKKVHAFHCTVYIELVP